MEEDGLLVELGRRARDLRAERGLTLRELGERSGLSVRFLAKVEAGEGNISVRNLAALARALGSTPAALLSGPGAESHLPVVALLGLRGAGKSSVGRRLARSLRLPFVELDRRIEEAAGLTLGEIFAVHGESYYRRLEHQTLRRILSEGRPVVLATGGGLVTSAEAWALLRRRAVTVWLRAQPEDHWNRVAQQGDRRPLEAHPQAMVELRRVLASREPLYAQAEHVVDTSRLGIEGSARAVLKALRGGEPAGSAPRPGRRASVARFG